MEAAGAATAVAGAVTGVVRRLGRSAFAPLVGRLSRRWHPARLIALGGAAAVAAARSLAVSQAPAVAVGVAVLLGLAWAAMHSSLQTWATEVLPAARAAVVSLFAGSLFVGSAVAAAWWPASADAGRYGVIFALAARSLAVPLRCSRPRPGPLARPATRPPTAYPAPRRPT